MLVGVNVQIIAQTTSHHTSTDGGEETTSHHTATEGEGVLTSPHTATGEGGGTRFYLAWLCI